MGVSEPSLGLEKQNSSPAYRKVTNHTVQSQSCQICKTGAAPRSAEQLGAAASGHLITPMIFNDIEFLSRSNAPRTVFVFLFPYYRFKLTIFLTFFQALSVALLPKPWSGNK